MTEYPSAFTNPPVSVTAYEPGLRKKYPGLRMRQHDARQGVELGFGVSTFITMEFLYSEDQAAQVVSVAVERLQIEAIHQVGLQPRIDAYEAELRRLRDENGTLQRTAERRANTIARLQEQIDQLLNPGSEDES